MQKAWSASLWAGAEACLSHRTAARLWELVEIEADTVEVSAPYQLWTSVSWLVPHKTASISRQVQRRKNGVAVTSPARTLVDLAAVVNEDTLQRAMESAFRRRIASVSEVRRVLRYLPESGRSGTGKAWRLLQRGEWSEDAQSELERRALQLFRRHRLPQPQCQYAVIEGDHSLGKVDFAWPPAKVIVEAEGFEFHSGRDAWDSDIARYNALVFHGWTVLRLTESDLRSRAASFTKALAKALARH
jgi:very-short-patch-repair endonuclease